ncbi:peptide-methionine (S)-S-oxide reductase, partial [Candidatus Azambacteria bacterium]|nr:peptide-methionine (S)-S-oxide reductase [Candidatus Azambacteria bacterium]
QEVSFRDLLTVFFATHDSTTLNRQGADVGTQYRSIILYTTELQKETAELFIQEINASSLEGHKVVTEIKPLDIFYPAETYHQDYYQKNQTQPYCQVVINPKLEKVQEKFAVLLKEDEKFD